MKTYKKHILLLIIIAFSLSSNAQKITSKKGYTPQIGIMVDMLEDLRKRVTRSVKNINQEQTDFLLDEEANSIGAIIMHLAAVETIWQNNSFEDRQFTNDEYAKWMAGLELGDKGREELKGKPIDYYLDIWNDVRKKTLATLKTKDDKWLASSISLGTNHHWAWFHVMEHQANHMGQIKMILKRAPK